MWLKQFIYHKYWLRRASAEVLVFGDLWFYFFFRFMKSLIIIVLLIKISTTTITKTTE